MHPDTRATTRSVQYISAEGDARFAEIAAQNPEIASLKDKDFAEAAMHPDVLAAELAAEAHTLDIYGQAPLAGGWLEHVVSSPQQGVWREPTAAERSVGTEVLRYDDSANTRDVAMIADRMPDIRALAMKNGKPSFRQDDYALGA